MKPSDLYQCHACGRPEDTPAVPNEWVWATKRNGKRFFLCPTCYTHMEALRFDKFAKKYRKKLPKYMQKTVFPSKKK